MIPAAIIPEVPEQENPETPTEESPTPLPNPENEIPELVETPETPDKENPTTVPSTDGKESDTVESSEKPVQDPVTVTEEDTKPEPETVSYNNVTPPVADKKTQTNNKHLNESNKLDNTPISTEVESKTTADSLITPSKHISSIEKLPETGEANTSFLSISGIVILLMSLWKLKR